MPKIRVFSEGDSGAMSEIANEAFGDEIDRGMPRFTSEGFIRSSERPGVKILIAEDSGRVEGFLSLTEGSTESPAQIHLVAVREEARGRGFSKELVKSAVEHVRGIGRGKLKLYSRPWNIAMAKVCLDLGFVPEACLRREYLDEELVQSKNFFLDPVGLVDEK